MASWWNRRPVGGTTADPIDEFYASGTTPERRGLLLGQYPNLQSMGTREERLATAGLPAGTRRGPGGGLLGGAPASPMIPVTPVPSADRAHTAYPIEPQTPDAIRGILNPPAALAPSPATPAQTAFLQTANQPYGPSMGAPLGANYANAGLEVARDALARVPLGAAEQTPQGYGRGQDMGVLPTRDVAQQRIANERAIIQGMVNAKMQPGGAYGSSPTITDAANRYRQQFAAGVNAGPQAERRMDQYRGLLRQGEQDRFGQEMARGQLANELEKPRIEWQGRRDVAGITGEAGIAEEEERQRGGTEQKRLETEASKANAATLAGAGGTPAQQIARQRVALEQARMELRPIEQEKLAIMKQRDLTAEESAAFDAREAAVWARLQGGDQQGAGRVTTDPAALQQARQTAPNAKTPQEQAAWATGIKPLLGNISAPSFADEANPDNKPGLTPNEEAYIAAQKKLRAAKLQPGRYNDYELAVAEWVVKIIGNEIKNEVTSALGVTAAT